MSDIVLTHLAEMKVLELPNNAAVVICPNCKKGPFDIEHLIKTTCPSCKNAFMGMGASVAYTSGNPDKLQPFLMEGRKKIAKLSGWGDLEPSEVLEKYRSKFREEWASFCAYGIKVELTLWPISPGNLCPICKEVEIHIPHNICVICKNCDTQFCLFGAILLYGSRWKQKDDFRKAFNQWLIRAREIQEDE